MARAKTKTNAKRAKPAAAKRKAPAKSAKRALPKAAAKTATKAKSIVQKTPSEAMIELLGCKVNVRRGGSGEPLLFLHGAGGIPAWTPYLARLAEKFHVIAPDHPSFSKSDTPEWLDDISDMAYFYLDFLAKEGLSGVHLVGQSLGGWIALEVAVRSTTRLKSLTLVGSAGIHVKGVPKADIFMMNPEETVRALYTDPAMIDTMLKMEPTPEQQDIIIKNRVATARLGWQPRLFNPKLYKWLHRVDVPTHIIWGDSDKIIPLAYANAFKNLIKGSSVTVIAKAGHLPHVERTDPFVSAVTGFIQRKAA